MLKSPTGVLVGHIFANAAEEKIVFFENGSRRGDSGPGPKFWREDSVRGIGTRISIEGLGKCPGTQVPVSECVMQKRFPAAGESRIHNTLRVSGLGARIANNATRYRRLYARIC